MPLADLKEAAGLNEGKWEMPTTIKVSYDIVFDAVQKLMWKSEKINLRRILFCSIMLLQI